MRIGVSKHQNIKRIIVTSSAVSVFLLLVIGFVSFGKQIWADRSDMTQIQFASALFCQRVSQAINDSLGDGMSDGSDCVNRNLYVSSDAIGNIRNLAIVPPEGGFGNTNLESQGMNINGGWVTAFYNLTSLSINDMYVQDISPLERLTGQLEYLDLSNNNIHDVSPLKEQRDNITYLDLSNNQISAGLNMIGKFSKLTTLKMNNSGLTYLDELFRPAQISIIYDDYTGAPSYIRDEETGEELPKVPRSSKLAKVLQKFYINDNQYMSYEREENEGTCQGSLAAFTYYPVSIESIGLPSEYIEETNGLVVRELYAQNNNLNTDDLLCVSTLESLNTLDVSKNHIDSFQSIRTKPFTMLKTDSQVFTRSVASLDYEPLPELFNQAAQGNYFTGATSNSNTAVSRNNLTLDNAQFNGDKVRFQNAAEAALYSEDSHPATVSIPDNTGAFENSRLEVYFAGQVVTFNDSNLCNRIYQQGESKEAFIDVDGSFNGSLEPVVLTNACYSAKKQIAMVSEGSSRFLRLDLDGINNGAPVDLTGLEEFPALQVLSMENDGLTDITILSNMYQLQQLWLSHNNLGNENWSIITRYLHGLTILYLNYNHMNEIPQALSNLYNLGDLYLVSNGISDVTSLANASSITVLDLSENDLITDISGMVKDYTACNPSILKLENSGVTKIPDYDTIQQGFSNLTSLNLNGNQITSETISNLAAAPRLDELYLNGNNIDNTTGFSEITSLKKLFLDSNRITEVNGLRTLTRLTELHLKDNQIDNITGLNTLPVLATLDLKNQTLNGTINDSDIPYELPSIFSQATTITFPRVTGFQSAGDYTVSNGTVDYGTMTATMTDTSEPMTVTIPDGGLTGSMITITYDGEGSTEFAGTITDDTAGGATITSTSSNSFTVTSEIACMALLSRNDGATWTRLESSTVQGDNNTRSFTVDQAEGAKVTIAYAGDANSDHAVNIRDARKIISSIIGRDSLSSFQTEVANVDGKNGVNIRDARAIINSILGTAQINW